MKLTRLQVIASDHMGSIHVDLGQNDPEISPKSNKSSHFVNTFGEPGARPYALIMPMEQAGVSTME